MTMRELSWAEYLFAVLAEQCNELSIKHDSSVYLPASILLDSEKIYLIAQTQDTSYISWVSSWQISQLVTCCVDWRHDGQLPPLLIWLQESG